MKIKDILVFENEHFFAVNKPRGLVVNKSQTVKGETLQDICEEYIGKEAFISAADDSEIAKEFKSRGGVVHRLDKDTTGVILVAKSAKDFEALKDLFLHKKISKTYYAVVFGDFSKILGENDYIRVDLPLGRNPTNRFKHAVVRDGREAVSNVYFSNQINENPTKTVFEYFGQTLSFLKILPETGRTHQIRVHLKALNLEIVGDVIYCGNAQTKFNREHNLPLLLHAACLEFKAFGEKFKIQAPLPTDFDMVY